MIRGGKVVYIQTDTRNKVVFIHNDPLDKQYGMGKSEQELLGSGYLVESLPTNANKDGCYSTMYYEKDKGFYFEYVRMKSNVYKEQKSDNDNMDAIIEKIQDDLVLSLIDNNIL